ncbi:MAG: agcs5 [Chlamydiales bacterium]|jgi:AGCS family alanine or glycine:cation symporter|nr:agcs5 [Chlamydiales bacterium]
MENFKALLIQVEDLVWGPPLLILFMGVGLYLTYKLKAIQLRYLPYALKLAFGPQTEDHKDSTIRGGISPFQSLMTGLAATIGIGNIAGVATAVMTGGLGALFWMWVTALLGMATRFSESVLAVKYRTHNSAGELIGGPMYYIEKGIGWKWLAICFAIFGSIAAIGTGNMVQINSVSQALHMLFGWQEVIIGFVLCILTGLMLFQGIKSIGKVSAVLVPIMAVFYVMGGLIILAIHYQKIPKAFMLIMTSAFTGQAALGGFLGATVMSAIQMGVARGIFSNESGLGSAPIAAAAAKTNSPVRQAMISMTGSFVATIVVCSITGFVIAVTQTMGLLDAQGKALNGMALTIKAFEISLPGGGYIVTIGAILFAYSTVLGWAYYGEKCFEYLCGEKLSVTYRWLYILTTIPAATIDLELIWRFADIANGLMAFPNLIAVFILAPVVVEETQEFLRIKTVKDRFNKP